MGRGRGVDTVRTTSTHRAGQRQHEEGQHGGNDGASGGSTSGTVTGPRVEPDEQNKKEIEEERKEHLDRDSRPDKLEVDNRRDVERVVSTDDEGKPTPLSDPEDPIYPDNRSGNDEESEDFDYESSEPDDSKEKKS